MSAGAEPEMSRELPDARGGTAPRAHAPVIPERSDEPLASSPQLFRLHKLGLIREALADGEFITRERAWAILAGAAEKGLWQATIDKQAPAWVPDSRRRR